MSRIIKIDPITRLEGHGNINILYDDKGLFKDAYLQVPDFRGFEKFCEGRAVEELPSLTQKICGVCPTAHHIAGVKALDNMYNVEPPLAARIIRELMINIFFFEDHLLHFYYLGGPDLFLDHDTPASKRNIFAVINRLGRDVGARILNIRKKVREMHSAISGSILYPVCGLPGGVSKAITEDDRLRFIDVSKDALDFAKLTMSLFREYVLESSSYQLLLAQECMKSNTYYMGLVDANNNVNFYDGEIRVIDSKGKEYCKFLPKDYLMHMAEENNPLSYMKYTYLKQIGWKGVNQGEESGIYRVGPLARLNVSSGFSTPLAHEEYHRMGEYFGEYPVHSTFAYHWARLIEILYVAENMVELTENNNLTDKHIRNLPGEIQERGVGACEAPRGILIHDYEADSHGIARKVNLLVATQNNGAAIQLSLSKAGRELFKNEYPDEKTLNKLEMVFRAYDPCMACSTH